MASVATTEGEAVSRRMRETRKPGVVGCAPAPPAWRQGLRSNVGTLMSTVSTLGVLTLALILLLAQCANTF